MKAIFLSASIPDPQRDPKYYRMGDVVRIRDAVDALVGVVLPRGLLVWGGHPAISPFVRRVADRMSLADRVKTWQSEAFRGKQPADTDALPGVQWIPVGRSKTHSLRLMREDMLAQPDLVAAVFIGGMDGVEDEHALFIEKHPELPVFAVASTGGAAREVWAKHPSADGGTQDRLANDMIYDLLFEDLVGPLLA